MLYQSKQVQKQKDSKIPLEKTKRKREAYQRLQKKQELQRILMSY